MGESTCARKYARIYAPNYERTLILTYLRAQFSAYAYTHAIRAQTTCARKHARKHARNYARNYLRTHIPTHLRAQLSAHANTHATTHAFTPRRK